MNYTELFAAIEIAMKKKRSNINQLADFAGCNPMSLTNWIKGVYLPTHHTSFEVVFKITQMLKIDASLFVEKCETVGDRIRYLRIKNFLSCEALAKKVGCHSNQIHQYETNRNKPVRKLKSLAAALGSTPEWILHGDVEVKKPVQNGLRDLPTSDPLHKAHEILDAMAEKRASEKENGVVAILKKWNEAKKTIHPVYEMLVGMIGTPEVRHCLLVEEIGDLKFACDIAGILSLGSVDYISDYINKIGDCNNTWESNIEQRAIPLVAILKSRAEYLFAKANKILDEKKSVPVVEPEVVVEVIAPEPEIVTGNAKPLVPIVVSKIGDQEVNSMSARDLYLDLGLDKTHWSRWSKENIVENEFLTQGVDFVQLAMMASAENPNPPKDYAVTINTAKHIAMMAKTQRAHDYRNYFIECEKKVINKQLPPVHNLKLSISELNHEYKNARELVANRGYTNGQINDKAVELLKQQTGVDLDAIIGKPKKQMDVSKLSQRELL